MTWATPRPSVASFSSVAHKQVKLGSELDPEKLGLPGEIAYRIGSKGGGMGMLVAPPLSCASGSTPGGTMPSPRFRGGTTISGHPCEQVPRWLCVYLGSFHCKCQGDLWKGPCGQSLRQGVGHCTPGGREMGSLT